MLSLRRLLITVVVLVIATASVVHFSRPDDRSVTAIRTPVTRHFADPPFAIPDLAGFMALVNTLTTERILGEYLDALAAEDARAEGPRRPPVSDPAPVAGGGGPIVVDYALWERLHVCEQSDTWYANGTNAGSGSGQVYQGGLGMSIAAWQMAVTAAAARGVVLPSSALDATPEQQMTGAQAFVDAYGWGWSCHV